MVKKDILINNKSKMIRNPTISLREESDDWALLYNPDTGASFSLNPVSVLVWKNLDGTHTIADLVAIIREKCLNVHDNVENQILNYIHALQERELVTEV